MDQPLGLLPDRGHHLRMPVAQAEIEGSRRTVDVLTALGVVKVDTLTVVHHLIADLVVDEVVDVLPIEHGPSSCWEVMEVGAQSALTNGS